MKAYMTAYAVKYNTRPEYVMAVAHIESRKGKQEFREGLMGRTYYGPMGIHRCFLNKWPVDQTEVNIEVGARALSNCDTTEKLNRRLRKYNASFNNGYWGAVVKAANKYREEGR